MCNAVGLVLSVGYPHVEPVKEIQTSAVGIYEYDV